ncbi:ABC transporter substrate-binding protein [Ruegeria sp. 2012CJ41-6]|uniref:ABC transporter substrate-binding protein n=1 Tax=Ruegeria spongiae TaxID=2942209 RepID=A0ABT0Q9K6_9RHOB|nr:ABC transporter substrate-binding protein [Ruegeria spongiae]MCL6286097.1 ABC transporter substrate-binding protein [Ruegeria spongiae]
MKKNAKTTGLHQTRRQLLATGLAAAAVPILGARQTFANTPTQGGTLRLGTGHGSTSDSMDPALNTSAFITLLSGAFANRLTEIDPNGEITPELAESWEGSENGKVWHFKLRQGVTFHNGKTMDADDVIATLNAHRGEESQSSVKALANQINEITKISASEIKIELTGANADYPLLLSAGAFAIMPLVDGELQTEAGIGTGGYILERIDMGVKAVLRKNPAYFKENAAFFDAVEINIINDPSARQNALLTGRVDVIDQVTPKTADLLARRPGVRLVEVAGSLHYTFPMLTNTAPFDDNNVRLALKYGCNRTEMVEKVLRGHGTLGNDHPIPVTDRYFNADLEQRQFDPDKAKFHLKEAGLDSLEVQLTASESIWIGALEAVQLYSERSKGAGLNIIPKKVPNDGYWSNVWMKEPWSAAYWSGRATPDWMFTAAYSADSSWNDTFWAHDRFNELLVKGRSELDESVRAGIYHEMQQIVSDEGGTVIPMFANHIMSVSDKIGVPDKVGGDWELDGGRAIERWWYTGN